MACSQYLERVPFLKNKVDMYAAKPQLLVAHSWYFVLLLCLINVIVSIANAASNDHAGRAGNKGGAFAAIWSMFVLCAYCWGGTWVLRKGRTPR